MSIVFPISVPPKCVHGRAKASDLCVTCGKPTRSHRIEETVARGDRVLSAPKTVTTLTQCPDCGDPVFVVHQAVQCHSCWEAAKVPEEL